VVIIKNVIFWAVKPYSSVEVHRVSEECVISILRIEGRPFKKPARSRHQVASEQ
jgi:hypothetical protein